MFKIILCIGFQILPGSFLILGAVCIDARRRNRMLQFAGLTDLFARARYPCLVAQARPRRNERFVRALAVLVATYTLWAAPVRAVTGGPVDRIAGIVTDRDIVLNGVTRGRATNDLLVADVMTANVVTIGAGADLSDAMEVMATHGVRRLATTDQSEDIIGVLSFDDIIEALGRDLG